MPDLEPRTTDAHERTRLRRSLLQLGGLLLLTLLTTTLLGLFSAWSLERAHLRSEATLVGFLDAVNLGREAQVGSKRQVQEWKDLLLRGAEPEARQRYRAAFEASYAMVQQRLQALAALLAERGQADAAKAAEAVATAHAALLPRYRAAMEASEAAWDPFAIDRAVRGIDRPLNEQFDALVDDLRAEARTRFDEDQAQLRARYEALTRVLWTAMVLAVAVLGVLLWRVLRTRATA